MREGAPEGSRPKLGRRPHRLDPNPTLNGVNNKSKMADDAQPVESAFSSSSSSDVSTKTPAKIQTENTEYDPREPLPDHNVSPDWSPRPGPSNCNFGPVITKEMLDQWGSVGQESNSRPVRSTRNPKPTYVDSVEVAGMTKPWSASKIELEALNRAINTTWRCST